MVYLGYSLSLLFVISGYSGECWECAVGVGGSWVDWCVLWGVGSWVIGVGLGACIGYEGTGWLVLVSYVCSSEIDIGFEGVWVTGGHGSINQYLLFVFLCSFILMSYISNLYSEYGIGTSGWWGLVVLLFSGFGWVCTIFLYDYWWIVWDSFEVFAVIWVLSYVWNEHFSCIYMFELIIISNCVIWIGGERLSGGDVHIGNVGWVWGGWRNVLVGVWLGIMYQLGWFISSVVPRMRGSFTREDYFMPFAGVMLVGLVCLEYLYIGGMECGSVYVFLLRYVLYGAIVVIIVSYCVYFVGGGYRVLEYWWVEGGGGLVYQWGAMHWVLVWFIGFGLIVGGEYTRLATSYVCVVIWVLVVLWYIKL